MREPRDSATQHKKREQEDTLRVGGDLEFWIILDKQLHFAISPLALGQCHHQH